MKRSKAGSSKKNANNPELSDEEIEVKSAAKKKTARATGGRSTPHEAFAIVLDVGSNSAKKLFDEDVADLEHSKQLLDWVISRKVFTESNDKFSLIFFGHEFSRNELLPQHSNIYIHNEDYESVKVDWLKVLENEITSNPKCSGDYVSALFTALESLKVHAESFSSKELNGLTVTLVSNFAGLTERKPDLMKLVKPLVAGFKALDAQLLVIGPDFSSSPKSDAQAIGFDFIKALLPQVGGTAFSFREGLSQLKFFIPKQTQPRGQPFDLELGKDFRVRLQMYVKNTEATMKFSFNPVSSSSTELRKVRRYETATDGGININYADIDNMADEDFSGGKSFAGHPSLPGSKFVDKEDIIRGYRYGKSLIPFGKADQQLLEFPKEGKQLQLLQFTKLENILPHFLLNNCRYMLPLSNDDNSLATMSALVKAMLEQDVVALCRYAYNVNSNPRVACLIPKISKKSSLPILMHYTMPFNEDMRNYEFPALEKIGQEPSEFQLDLVDEYISNLLLASEDGANEKMCCKQIQNPKHQYQCQMLRQKAMHPGEPFQEIDRIKLLEMLSPPENLLDGVKDIIESAKEAFSLERNPYTKVAAFSTKKALASTQMQTEKLEQDIENTKLEAAEGKSSPRWNIDGADMNL